MLFGMGIPIMSASEVVPMNAGYMGLHHLRATYFPLLNGLSSKIGLL